MENSKSRSYLMVVAGVVALGLTLLGLSMLGGVDSAWAANVLIEVGATLVLFGPLFWAGRHVENRLDAVRESQEHIEQAQLKIEERQQDNASEIAALAEEVAQTQADLEQARAEMHTSVLARLVKTRSKDEEMIKAVAESPSCRGVADALNRAGKLGTIAPDGCRVELPNTHLYVRFPAAVATDHETYLEVTLELVQGTRVDHVTWTDAETVEEFLVRLGETVATTGHYPGDDLFDPTAILHGLKDLLDVTFRRHSGSDGVAAPLGPVVQWCAPQWAITKHAIVCTDPGREYVFDLNKFDTGSAFGSMIERGWVDEVSFTWAYDEAKALYEGGMIGQRSSDW